MTDNERCDQFSHPFVAISGVEGIPNPSDVFRGQLIATGSIFIHIIMVVCVQMFIIPI